MQTLTQYDITAVMIASNLSGMPTPAKETDYQIFCEILKKENPTATHEQTKTMIQNAIKKEYNLFNPEPELGLEMFAYWLMKNYTTELMNLIQKWTPQELAAFRELTNEYEQELIDQELNTHANA